MRTQEEIMARIEKVRGSDFFGYQRRDLIGALTFENAKPWLEDDVTADQWQQNTDPLKNILDYLPFAWNKANNCRGLSAARSLDHMAAWLWLLGDDDVSWIDEYDFYGKPHLVTISERFGFDWRNEDNDQWCSDEDGPILTANEVLGRQK